MKRRDYISPKIINEVISICANSVLRDLLKDIRTADYFSVIADEATDISRQEQMCVAVRWVDNEYQIHEASLGLFQPPDTKAVTLFAGLKDMLLRCSLPFSQCVGQAYDGASNMSGVRKGVQALVKKENDDCLYVHCFAHSLNLCVQEVSKKVDLIRNTMEFIASLLQLIKLSPKRSSLLSSIQQGVKPTLIDSFPLFCQV